MFEAADGLFGTYITEKWLVDELSSLHGTKISSPKFRRVGENEGSFSRICLIESDSGGSLPTKMIVKIPTCLTYVENRKRRGWTQGDFTYVKDLLKQYHNTETLFYQYAHDIPGVPRTFLSYALDKDDRGIICMEYFEGCSTLPVYEDLSIEQMKSVLKLYAGIQYGCHNFPDTIRGQLNHNVFETLASTTLSQETLTQRFERMSTWAPEIASTLDDVIKALPKILDHKITSRLHFSCPFRPLLVHGDFYSSNILWKNGNAVAIIDYHKMHLLSESLSQTNLVSKGNCMTKALQQYYVHSNDPALLMTHFGNPVEDLLRLFCIGLSCRSRNENTTILLQYYLDIITTILPEMKNVMTLEQLMSWCDEIFPVAGLWTIVSLQASYEAATSHLPEDKTRTKSVQEKIHGVALDILEKSIDR